VQPVASGAVTDPVQESADPARTSARPSRWDRPPEPHDWRWVVGWIGRVLIAVGLLMFGFVAYQLWGTGVATAQSQNRLEAEFEDLLAAPPTVGQTTTTAPADTAPDGGSTTTSTTIVGATTSTAPPVTAPDVKWTNGSAVARIEIPRLQTSHIVVEGVRTGDLKEGPGHFPETPMPGQLGNTAIAGHRTTYGAPFGEVDKLAIGDEVIFTVPTGRFVYAVTNVEIVDPSDYDKAVPTQDPTLATMTLVSCHPKYTAAQRIIVRGALVADASPPPMAPPADLPDPEQTDALPGDPTTTTPDGSAPPTTDATGSTTPGATPTTASPDASTAEVVDPLAAGWFSDPGAWPQVALWGLGLALIGVVASLLSRRVRRNWVGALAGLLPFAVALWFFYENVIRLLPAAL
jgi:sortase A